MTKYIKQERENEQNENPQAAFLNTWDILGITKKFWIIIPGLFGIFSLLIEAIREWKLWDTVVSINVSAPFLAWATWIYLIVFIGCLTIYGGLKPKLLEIRKLYALSGTSYFQTPMVIIAILFIISVPIASVVFGLVNNLGWATLDWFDTPGGRSLYLSFVSIFLFHFVDFHTVDQELSLARDKGLLHTIDFIEEVVQSRVPEDREDRSFDRGVTKVPKLEMLRKMKSHLTEMDKDLREARLKYGTIANLYHPDYLPHLSYIYLENSQLRALNVPPRRVQLLGRKWSTSGLLSEYVIVHDISDLKRDFEEGRTDLRNEMTNLFKKYLENLSSAKGKVTAQSEKQDAVFKRLLHLYEQFPADRWGLRSLKKRAFVTVAADGTLLQISIEEERQVNV